ncbi:unnamed protein product [Microthlaspi erraticum]|uniref:LOB domain-containing protein n=1 Tax=Microthlaspi erraticum TaxID=1685480 RepID=A0A6D2KTC9_9BRAS|nr:unnamed protein product [Microthlaspi erraticum]
MDSNCCAASMLYNIACIPEPASEPGAKPTCMFAAHFPTTNLAKFEKVNKVFGLGTVQKILSLLGREDRKRAVTALCYEADARLRDPIFGCDGMVLQYQKDLQDLNKKIASSQSELASIVGPDNVPKYNELPIPDDFLATEKMEGLTEDQQNQVTQLPTVDAQKILTEMFGNHGADDGASTSAGPSKA